MLTKILGILAGFCIGAIIPIIALLKAFENVDKMTPWGWAGVTLISITAMGCGVGILIASKFFKN